MLGPLIGGFFVEQLSWRWIFYVNLPLGLAVLVIIGWAFSAPATRRRPSIDIAGAALLAATLTALILLASLGGHTIAWTSPPLWAWPADRWRRSPGSSPSSTSLPNRSCRCVSSRTGSSSISCAVGFIVGFALFGSVTFMPMYLQVVKGVSPTSAGMMLTPMMAGVLVTSIASGRIISRIGRYRPFPIVGTAI